MKQKPRRRRTRASVPISHDEVRVEKARRHLLDFMAYTWYNVTEPLTIGYHTRAVCAEIDKAIARFKQGKSTFLVITLPIRHGKSDMGSRFLPPFFLGQFPDKKVMLTSYSSDLPEGFSRDARDYIMDTAEYRRVFPNIQIPNTSKAINNWSIKGHIGGAMYAGLEGGLTGKGYSLGICDDPFKDAEEAESETIRDKRWDAFTQTFLSRRGPVSITLLVASPWHEDDIIGRIERAMGKDTNFPQFTILRYPAKDPKYPSGYLFPERYSPEWYEANFAFFGEYRAAALLQCQPTPRGGAMFKTDRIRTISASEVPDGLRWVRPWDLASSKKERDKDDPDYTAGGLMAMRETKVNGFSMYEIWVKNVERGQWEAPERDRRIIQCACKDGPAVSIAIEAVAGYKDSYTTLKNVLMGVRTVEKITTTTDKISRAAPLEPIIEAGNFFIVEGDWNDDFKDEFKRFPRGKHDDQVDMISTGYHHLKSHTRRMGVYIP